MRLPIFLLAIFLLGQQLATAIPHISYKGLFADGINSDSDSESASSENEFLENVAGWRPPHSAICPKGQFRLSDGNCKQCSNCGPDFYERQPCKDNRDTRCESCYSEFAKSGLGDFDEKCAETIQLRREFRRVMAAQYERERKASAGFQSQVQSTVHFTPVHHLDGAGWWKAELAVEMAFYLALIALVLAVIRFLCKARPSAGTYRTVQISPPALDDMDQKNIVRAADSIREKLGKKGYDRLEEEFI